MTTPPGNLLSFAEAAARIHAEAGREVLRLDSAGSGPVEHVPLESAFGRVLAEPIRASRSMPPFNRSTRDGFAVRAAELAAGSLRIAGTTHAGEPIADALEPGKCRRVMTGAAIPAGADAVVMLEHIVEAGGAIALAEERSLSVGANMVPRGAEAESGAVLVAAGHRLRAQEVALAAASGIARPAVYCRPTAAVFSTGNEVVPLAKHPDLTQIYDSNSYALAALSRAAGAQPERLPVVADDREALRQAFQVASTHDAVITSGGVSAGELDLVEEVLAELGAQTLFTGVRIQPGKPVAVARRGHPTWPGRWQWIFALPGNPISAMVTFQLFARPLLQALGGEQPVPPVFARLPLLHDWSGPAGLTRFIGAKVTPDGVELLPSQGSGDLAAFSRADALVVLPETVSLLRAGAPVEIWQWS